MMRANYQAMVWSNDLEPDPQLPFPQNLGWESDDKKLLLWWRLYHQHPKLLFIQWWSVPVQNTDVITTDSNVQKQISTSPSCVTTLLVEDPSEISHNANHKLKETQDLAYHSDENDSLVIFSQDQGLFNDRSYDLVRMILRLLLLDSLNTVSCSLRKES